MKNQFLKFLLSTMLIFVCIGCGAKNTTSEPTTKIELATEENTPVQKTETTDEPAINEEVATEPETMNEPTINEEVATEPETTDEPATSEEVATEPETTGEPTQEQEPEPVPEPQATYTYTDISATMYATQTVNIRNLPSTDGEKIGSLSENQEITITAQCNETGWYMFDYNGQTAFVSNKYLSNEKAEVTPPAQETSTTTNSNEAFPYELYVMYYDNMGYPYFYHIGLNSLYISEEDLVKEIACKEAQSEYVFEHFRRADDSCSFNPYWGPVGKYKRGNDPIYVIYIYECNDVILPPPEQRGIFTAGLHWPDHLF